jgi:hypothetical protein
MRKTLFLLPIFNFKIKGVQALELQLSCAFRWSWGGDHGTGGHGIASTYNPTIIQHTTLEL